MAVITFEVEGLRELQAALTRAGVDAVPAMRTALGSAALIVQNAAKIKAPYRSGNLRRSIHHEVTESSGSVEAIVGTDVEYAKHVEYGTGIHAENGMGRKTPWRFKGGDGNWYTTRGSRPKPFLRPALAENREAVMREIRESIRKLLP